METWDISKLLSSAPAPVVIGLLLTIFLKMLKSTPHVADWSIPYCAVSIGALVNGALWGFSSRNVVEGILIGGFAVFGNQLFRQTTDRIKEGPETDETREFRRRFEAMTDKKVSEASQGGPQTVVVTTPSQPAKREVITKEKPVDPTA